MSEHFKNILSGIGSVFVSPSPMRGYTRVRRDGFARDARNLAADRRRHDCLHCHRHAGRCIYRQTEK